MPHTPMPWSCERQDDDSGEIYWAIHSHHGYEFVCNAYKATDGNLISAAPELLAACKSLLETLNGDFDGEQAAQANNVARAAIAKAEGK